MKRSRCQIWKTYETKNIGTSVYYFSDYIFSIMAYCNCKNSFVYHQLSQEATNRSGCVETVKMCLNSKKFTCINSAYFGSKLVFFDGWNRSNALTNRKHSPLLLTVISYCSIVSVGRVPIFKKLTFL